MVRNFQTKSIQLRGRPARILLNIQFPLIIFRMSTPYDFTELPDGLWAKFEPLLEPFKRKRSGGSPPISSRSIMNGIIFRLKTGCQWNMIPKCYGSKSTIHEHYRRWAKHGVFDQLMKICLEDYHRQQGLHLLWQSMDGSLIQAPVRTKKRCG